MGAYAAWIAVSSLWSISSPATVREVERMLVYVADAFAMRVAWLRLAQVARGAERVHAYARVHQLDPATRSSRASEARLVEAPSPA